jgi:hypothetical protein
MLLGEEINLERLSNLAGTMVRVASRLGLSRRPRTMDEATLSDVLAEAQASETENPGSETEMEETVSAFSVSETEREAPP